ncbi:BQ2448_86 [Microbotryum intermedium]|uniref:BQ2448_86 protein n=1 Tax=Microbotryum intermedium TaxID=269621 RepID=A0A238F4K1_9BASI|nr:BQ2448_86 [Microbotryum intermedium]
MCAAWALLGHGVEGGPHPPVFIPQLNELRKAGYLPLDKSSKQFALGQIKHGSVSGGPYRMECDACDGSFTRLTIGEAARLMGFIDLCG